VPRCSYSQSVPELVDPTASQVKKAGQTIRRWQRGESVSLDQLNYAYYVITRFRALYQLPLVKANNGLRSMLRTESCPVEVSQRLKRIPTIIDKLKREPSLALSSMHDIGGCRAVLDNVDQVRRVSARLQKNRPPIKVRDYITNPRESGYRGIHVIVGYDERPIEVQLRTRLMHQWAITVERTSWRLKENLKGDGDHPVQRLLKAISQAMALDEAGAPVPVQLIEEMDRLRAAASPYLLGGGRQ
jgi:putative GTP pyrophosphokinase